MKSLRLNAKDTPYLINLFKKYFSSASAHKPSAKTTNSMTQSFHNVYLKELERQKQLK